LNLRPPGYELCTARSWRLARAIVFTALATGLRRGELLGLRWRDVDFNNGLLHVREAIVLGRVETPKTKTSLRTIEVAPRALSVLAAHKSASAFQGDDERVFCHPLLGTPADPSKLSKSFLKPALAQARITKPFRPFHDLRHTAITHEAAAGNPTAYVQLRAGHSSSATTERYIHAAGELSRRGGENGSSALCQSPCRKTCGARASVEGARQSPPSSSPGGKDRIAPWESDTRAGSGGVAVRISGRR